MDGCGVEVITGGCPDIHACYETCRPCYRGIGTVFVECLKPDSSIGVVDAKWLMEHLVLPAVNLIVLDNLHTFFNNNYSNMSITETNIWMNRLVEVEKDFFVKVG